MFNTRYLFGNQLGLIPVWVPHTTLLHGDQAKLVCVLHAQFFQKSHFDLKKYGSRPIADAIGWADDTMV